MDKCITSFGEAAIYSTLDNNNGYRQVEIDKADRIKPAVASRHKLYRFIRMLFCLRNAPGTLQRTVDVMVSTVRWKLALEYLEDTISFSRFLQEHVGPVRMVFTLSRNAGIALKLK